MTANEIKWSKESAMDNIEVVVKLPRESPEAQPIKRFCEDNFGVAEWDDSGKGNRFGTLQCNFKNAENAAAFLLTIIQRGFTVEILAFRK
jgi:hypothetical protein